jgi:hypothetical protein
MNPNDLMKSMIMLITQADAPEQAGQLSPLSQTPDNAEPNREKQIVDLLPDHENQAWVNEPEEKYADIDAVTCNAGGGVNSPKHPSDIRVKDPSMYPTAQDHEPKKISIHDALMAMLGGK